MEDPTTIRRLNELLDMRDATIQELEAEVADLRRRLELDPKLWSMPVRLPSKQTLPVPRLHLEVTVTGGVMRTQYGLVYQDPFDGVRDVPLQVSVRTGARFEMPPMFGDKIDVSGHYRTIARKDAAQLRLPAFLVCGDIVERLDTEEV